MPGRLASISWFMRCLCEPIARCANREDKCTGRFWEGRFKSQALLDEAALLACSLYVDLNPVRAAICDRPEEAEFTSAHDRIQSRQARQTAISSGKTSQRGTFGSKPSRCDRHGRQIKTDAARDGWLCPIRPEEPTSCASSVIANIPSSSRRASDQSCLSMSLDDYLQILDWTGRQIKADKRGSIPENLSPILVRLSVVPERWMDSVCEFGRRFRRAVGHPERVLAEAARSGKQWFGGVSMCRQAFTSRVFYKQASFGTIMKLVLLRNLHFLDPSHYDPHPLSRNI